MCKPCLNGKCNMVDEVPLCKYCPDSAYRNADVERNMIRKGWVKDGKHE